MTYADLAKVEYLPFGESVELIKNASSMPALQSAGLGVASIRDPSTSVKIVVPVPADVVAKVGDAAYQTAVIPAHHRRPDAGCAHCGHSQLPGHALRGLDELAYQMAKQMYENLDTLYGCAQRRQGDQAEGAPSTHACALHPGAERYYREVGWSNKTVAPHATGAAGNQAPVFTWTVPATPPRTALASTTMRQNPAGPTRHFWIAIAFSSFSSSLAAFPFSSQGARHPSASSSLVLPCEPFHPQPRVHAQRAFLVLGWTSLGLTVCLHRHLSLGVPRPI